MSPKNVDCSTLTGVRVLENSFLLSTSRIAVCVLYFETNRYLLRLQSQMIYVNEMFSKR